MKEHSSIMDLERFKAHYMLGELDNDDWETLAKNIDEIIRENDSVLMIPLCQKCYSKKKSSGREIKFKNDLYRVY